MIIPKGKAEAVYDKSHTPLNVASDPVAEDIVNRRRGLGVQRFNFSVYTEIARVPTRV